MIIPRTGDRPAVNQLQLNLTLSDEAATTGQTQADRQCTYMY